MAHYMLTNDASKLEERIAAQAFKDLPRYAALDADAVRALWGVEADYLDTALRAVEDRCGTLDRYLDEVLQIDRTKREALRRHYLDS